MSSQPSDHAAWRLPPDASQQPLNVNSYNANLSTGLVAPAYTDRVASHNAVVGNPSHGPQQTSRKRQFRFSVRADIDLLKLVMKLNPYGAPHGGRLHKWHAIADTLKNAGIDIDFRRARDRTGLLLDQWREQDLSLLRRSGSGNHEDQAQKEQLLERISQIEHAAKPRDSSADWRNRDHVARMRDTQHAHASASQADSGIGQGPSAQPSMNAILSGDPRAGKFGTFSSGTHPAGHLPPLMQKHESRGMSQTRIDNELHGLRFGHPHAGHSAEKRFKANHGTSLSPRFTQPLFEHPPSPPKPASLHGLGADRRSPQRTDLSSYRPELSFLRQTSQPVHRAANPSLLGTAQLDVIAANPVSSSPHTGEGQNIQLDPMQSGLARQLPESSMDHLRAQVSRLQQRVDEQSEMYRKHLEREERRLAWDKEREMKRLEVEKNRIEKEAEERKAEREERRRREQADREERERLTKIIMRYQGRSGDDGDNTG